MTIPSRRSVIVSSVGLSTVSLLGCVSPDTKDLKNDNPSSVKVKSKMFVLVHGAWHGGWCWRDVRAELEKLGHKVFTPTLTGLGERSHINNKSINLTTHVTDILNVIKYEELEDIILVGHSYAGFVVSLVADVLKDRISKVIYVDAVLPVEGESFIKDVQKDGVLAAYGNDFVLPNATLEFLGIPGGHEHADWVLQNLTPHPLGTLLEPVAYNNGGPKGIPKTFIRCMKTPQYENGDSVKAMTDADPEWTYVTLDTGHDAMVTAPVELSKLLLN